MKDIILLTGISKAGGLLLSKFHGPKTLKAETPDLSRNTEL